MGWLYQSHRNSQSRFIDRSNRYRDLPEATLLTSGRMRLCIRLFSGGFLHIFLTLATFYFTSYMMSRNSTVMKGLPLPLVIFLVSV